MSKKAKESHVVKGVKAPGNTKPAHIETQSLQLSNCQSKKENRCSPSKRWTFTYYYLCDKITCIAQLKDWIVKDAKFYIYGFEVCPDTKRLHVQGFVEWNKACRPKEKVPNKTIHWEKAGGDNAENYLYCCKEEDFYTNMEGFKPLIDYWLTEATTKYEWQTNTLTKIYTVPNGRDLNWICGIRGRDGKSLFVRHLIMAHNCLLVSGKNADIMMNVYNYIKANGTPRAIIVDIPRSNKGFVAWGAIEELLNSGGCSNKFESTMFLFNRVHVYIFANFIPDDGLEIFSEDRWKIVLIDDNKKPPVKEAVIDYYSTSESEDEEEEEKLRFREQIQRDNEIIDLYKNMDASMCKKDTDCEACGS